MSRKKSYFVWTEEKKYVLAQLTLKYKGYKNSDRTHAEKWEQILEKLKLKVGFEELDIKLVPLHNHFKRMMEDVSELTGTSREGANLSGLPEEPSEYIKIMLNMYEEVQNNENIKKGMNEKKAAERKKMTMEEKRRLQGQGLVHVKEEELATPTSDNDPDAAFTLHQVPSTKPDSSSNSGSRKGKTFLDEFKKEVISLLDEDEDKKESKKKKIELDERKILLEERKLKLREDELTEAREARIMQNKRNDENINALSFFSLDRLSSVKMPLFIINLLIVEIISKDLDNCLTINKSFALIP